MMKIQSGILSVVALAAVCGILSGCDSPPQKPQSIATEARVGEIVEMRKIFDAHKGDWNAVPEDQKKRYTELAGDEEKAKTMWFKMANPGPTMEVPGKS
jgi:hypothetical protein